MYTYEDNKHQSKIEGRYWNCQGTSISIVASVTKNLDWAAYIGATCCATEREALAFTAGLGSKLQEEDARHFFPEITLPYRR